VDEGDFLMDEAGDFSDDDDGTVVEITLAALLVPKERSLNEFMFEFCAICRWIQRKNDILFSD